MHRDIEEVLFTREEIDEKVKELGRQITEDYRGKEVIAVCVLKGGVFFTTDLLKEIDIPIRIEFMDISSYGSGTESSGELKILKDLDTSVNGKDVLIIEDIIDTGRTINHLKHNLQQRGASSVKIVSLLNKPAREIIKIDADYLGFVIDDLFVVGYGLDFDEKYRNLPYIGYLKEEIYK